MAAFGGELSRLVDELNRQKAATVSGGSPSIDRLLALAAQRGVLRHRFGGWFRGRAPSQGLSDAGCRQALIVRGNTQLIASVINRPAGRGVRSEQVVGLLFRARADWEIPSQFSLSARYAGGLVRLLPAQIPSLESLHLPAALAELAERRQGLVLLTGPTGCGKTSTLAALLA